MLILLSPFLSFLSDKILIWCQNIAIREIRKEQSETESGNGNLPEKMQYPEDAESAATFLTGPAMDKVLHFIRLRNQIQFCVILLMGLSFFGAVALPYCLITVLREGEIRLTVLLIFAMIPFALFFFAGFGFYYEVCKHDGARIQLINNLKDDHDPKPICKYVDAYNQIMQLVRGETGMEQQETSGTAETKGGK